MIEKIEELMESDFAVKVLAGISVALAIMCMLFAIVTFILFFMQSVWWLLATFVCVIATGAFFGMFGYLIDV